MPEAASRLEVCRRTVLTALSLFLTTTSFTLARTGRDALYFRADSAAQAGAGGFYRRTHSGRPRTDDDE